MLYKFKSQAAGDIIMLETNGRQLLKIIGKDDEASLIKGILLPEQMPAAIAALESAIATEESNLQQQIEEAQAEGEAAPRPEAITLRQRAVPFMDMIQRCHKAQKEIVWGV